jgi:hypothetical protein
MAHNSHAVRAWYLYTGNASTIWASIPVMHNISLGSWYVFNNMIKSERFLDPYLILSRYMYTLIMMKLQFAFISLLVSVSLAETSPSPQTHDVTSGGHRYECKCYPGDRCWPSASKWKTLNSTVQGALKEVVPDAAVCYNTFDGKSTYNAAACANATQNFPGEQWTYVLLFAKP